jgi:hypothetical protein
MNTCIEAVIKASEHSATISCGVFACKPNIEHNNGGGWFKQAEVMLEICGMRWIRSLRRWKVRNARGDFTHIECVVGEYYLKYIIYY